VAHASALSIMASDEQTATLKVLFIFICSLPKVRRGFFCRDVIDARNHPFAAQRYKHKSREIIVRAL